MKTTLLVLGIILLALACSAGVQYLIQRFRQKRAEKDGVVIYATVVSSDPIRALTKYLDMRKITLRIQEPDASPREVVLRTRTAPGQKIVAGVRLIVVVDPASPKRVYPASPEAAKRVVLTGSRMERRVMRSQLRSPGRGAGMRPPSGYQPPASKIR